MPIWKFHNSKWAFHTWWGLKHVNTVNGIDDISFHCMVHYLLFTLTLNSVSFIFGPPFQMRLGLIMVMRCQGHKLAVFSARWVQKCWPIAILFSELGPFLDFLHIGPLEIGPPNFIEFFWPNFFVSRDGGDNLSIEK